MKYVAIDVGGTFIKHALLDETGQLIQQNKIPTPLTTQEDFLAVIQTIVDDYPKPIEGVALSLPGTIDATSGFVFQGGTLTYNAMCNLKKLLEDKLQVPVELENDAHCAALAELWKGNLVGIQHAMVITFGTGIGGCLIINGEPYKGMHLFAGEVSVLFTKDINQYGMNAIWGPQGSFSKFVKRVCDHLQIEVVDGETVMKWVEEHDDVVYPMFLAYCDDLVQQFYNFQMLLDPQRICIGGGVSANPIYLQSIQEAMNRLYDQIPLPLPRLELVACKFHNDSNLLGALYHFQRQQQSRRE